MPQMKPLNWSILMFYFIVLFLVNLIINYFNPLYLSSSFHPSTFPKKKINMNWQQIYFQFLTQSLY